MVLGERLTKLTVFVGICLGLVSGCEEGHDHSRRLQTSAPLTPPTRPLQWGDVNIIHTTDTHGWLLGHQKKSFPEPNYRWVLVWPSGNILLLTWQWRFRRFRFIYFSYETNCWGNDSWLYCNAKKTQVRTSKRMWTCFWLIPETFMMVSCRIPVIRYTTDCFWILGTGLVDGFPAGGIDGHDVWFS